MPSLLPDLHILPWFRVHITLLNDPGRLIGSHLTHTSLIAGWSCFMILYELFIVGPSDPVYNPIWRQGRYQMPFLNCLSVTQTLSMNTTWTYETVILAHIILSGPLLLAAS